MSKSEVILWEPLVSVVIVAYNEESHLPSVLADMRNQDYKHSNIELILVNNASSDNTSNVIHDFTQSANDFKRVIAIDSSRRELPVGWNLALQECVGEVIIRIDAHAAFPSNFLSQNVAVLSAGETVCGGPRPCITPPNATDWQEVLLAAEESLFGSSVARYRSGRGDGYVKSAFHAAYRKEILNEVGQFNEELVRTEDNDMSYRIRSLGYKIRFDTRINSQQIIRPTLRGMIKQKYSNGYWIGRTLLIQPKCLGTHHILPGAAVLSGLVTSGLYAKGIKTPLATLILLYLSLDSLMTYLAYSERGVGNWKFASLLFIFPALHSVYGIGTLAGFISGISHKLKKLFL